MMSRSQSFWIFFFVSLILHTFSSPWHQRDALLEFKNEFPINASDPDAPLRSWNTSSDCSSWHGVTCDGKSNEVISLVLDYISLNGCLKPNSSLFKLKNLRHLSLFNCNLRGEIPASLGNLSHLIVLNLVTNHLVGEIPSSLGNLNQLTSLNIASNNLTGKLPSSLGNLSRLTHLELSNNHLIGEVPPALGNLKQVSSLGLESNNLRGNIPISFANFTNLSTLHLSDNHFSGDFHRLLPNLTSLTGLYLSNNHFKSTLPHDMSGLHNLGYLDVRGNSLVGNFPASLFRIPTLVAVDLSGNQFEGPLEFGNTSSSSYFFCLLLDHNNFNGEIPESISGFLNLKFLDLSYNRLIGSIPRSMSKLVSLSKLYLSSNKLEGQVPSFVWGISLTTLTLSHNYFTSLEKPSEVVASGEEVYIDIASNSLRGLFPQWICKFTSLGLLDLSNNHLTGFLPSCLVKNLNTSLSDLNLRNNNFSGFLPDIFKNATVLRSLDVSGNQFVGKLPKSLINCNNLEFLNLRRNKIKDTFPSWLSSLGSLRVLLLGSNSFYGPIYSPSAYFGFPSLRVIDISQNTFSGTLPQDYFGNWLEMSSVLKNGSGMYEGSYFMEATMGGDSYGDSMVIIYKGVETEFSKILLAYKAIDFSGNKLSGRIPISVGLLKGLRLLNFSGNAFTGSIPSTLANLTYLEALDLSGNNLSGHIPLELGNLTFLSYMDFSNNLLQGPVPRSTQFQRQNCSSFADNDKLYGLEEICGRIRVPDATPQQPEHSSSEPEEVLNWIAAAISYGPGVFCGLVIGNIFNSHKHKRLMRRFRRNNPSGTTRAH